MRAEKRRRTSSAIQMTTTTTRRRRRRRRKQRKQEQLRKEKEAIISARGRYRITRQYVSSREKSGVTYNNSVGAWVTECDRRSARYHNPSISTFINRGKHEGSQHRIHRNNQSVTHDTASTISALDTALC